MEVFWFWLVVLLLVLAIFAWPTWPYTRNRWVYRRPGAWRYAPAGAAVAVLLLLLIFFWFGLLVIAWPGGAVQPA